MSKKQNKLTAENLKQTLWQTLCDLRAKKIDAQEATAVASASREIMRVVRVEMDLAKMTGVVPSSAMLDGKEPGQRLKAVK